MWKNPVRCEQQVAVMMGEEWCLRKVLSHEEEIFEIIVVARVKAAPDSSSL